MEISSKDLFKKYLQERMKLDKQISYNEDITKKADEAIKKQLINKQKDLEAKKERYRTDPEFKQKRIEASTAQYYKGKEKNRDQEKEITDNEGEEVTHQIFIPQYNNFI